MFNRLKMHDVDMHINHAILFVYLDIFISFDLLCPQPKKGVFNLLKLSISLYQALNVIEKCDVKSQPYFKVWVTALRGVLLKHNFFLLNS